MTERTGSLAGCHDVMDEELVILSRSVLANDHAPLYSDAIRNIRIVLQKARQLMDDRATGQFPRLTRERRDTPEDLEAQTPPLTGEIVERRRRGRSKDRDR